jgi:preprotein translocase subunit SecA
VAIEIIESVCSLGADQFFRSRSEEGGWDPEGYRQWLLHLFPVTFDEYSFDQDHLEIEDIEQMATNKVVEALKEKLARENAKVPGHLIAMGESPYPAHAAIRSLMIRKTDQMWQEHLLRMDYLRSDVTLRAVGQRDPLMEFKHEAFALFDELSRQLRTEVARSLFRFEIITPEHTLQQLLQSGVRLETNRSLFEDFQKESSSLEDNEVSEDSEEASQAKTDKSVPFVAGPRVGRNDLCPCGSGKKFKKCCGQLETV